MPRRIFPTNDLNTPGLISLQPLSLGGTQADNPSDATTNLQILSLAQANQPNGYAQLGIDGKISVEYFSSVLLNQAVPVITGPLVLGLGQTGTYTITNYDSNNAYTLNNIGGQATLNAQTIQYTAPGTPGTYGFILNGLSVSITVSAGEVTVSGVQQMLENTTSSFQITNYNASIQYTVQAVGGFVTLSGNTITYTAPSTNGITKIYSGFLINGVLVNIEVDPAPVPVVTGPTSAAIGQVVTFTITNYIPSSTYQISATGGSFVDNHDGTISFTAPSTPGVFSLTINATTLAINVVLPTIAQPSIISPTNNAANLGPSVYFTASNFAMSVGSDTQTSASWQIATDSAFTSVVVQSLNDTTNLSTWTVPNLQNNTTYYVRVQYTGLNQEVSPWSAPISFKTKQYYIPIQVSALINGGSSTNFGYQVATNSTATALAIGAPQGNAVFIYTRTQLTWTLSATINAPSGAAGFGQSVYINDQANTIIIGAVTSKSAYIYTLVSGAWQLSSTFLSPLATGAYGYQVAINEAANLVFISDYQNNSVYVYNYIGTSWSLTQTIAGPGNSYFGYSLSTNSTASLVCIGAYLQNSAYIYSNTGQTWSILQTFTGPQGSQYFGVSVDISRLSYTVMITDDGAQKVYVYTSTNGAVWNLYQTIPSPQPSTTAYFGRSCAINGQGGVFVVGAYAQGTVYLYQIVGSQYVLSGTFTQSPLSSLGFSCAISSDGSYAVSSDPMNNAVVGLS